MNPLDYCYTINENGFTSVWRPAYGSDEDFEAFLKYSRNTGAYIGYVASEVAQNNPKYAVCIPGSNTRIVLVPHWCENYIVGKENKETILILLDGKTGRGTLLIDGTTTMRIVAADAKIDFKPTPGRQSHYDKYDICDTHDTDTDDNKSHYLKLKLEEDMKNFDLWTSKPYDKTETNEQREKNHLELGISAFKYFVISDTRGGKTMSHTTKLVYDTIMNGEPEWKKIYENPRLYFKTKREKIN